MAIAIRAARAAAGWSQAEMAERVSASRITILRIESGDTKPRPNLLEKIIEVFKQTGITMNMDGPIIITVDYKEKQ